jgi:hypothetical protein
MKTRLFALLLAAITACSPAASGTNSPANGSTPDSGTATVQPSDGGTSNTGVVPVDPNLPAVRFVALGDTGRGNAEQYAVAKAMETKCALSGCDFGVLLGDNIYDNGVDGPDDPQFQDQFELPYANLNFPFYAVLGNHDYGGHGIGSDFYKGKYQIEYSSRSSKWRMPAAYYRFTEKNVEFFALDTNAQMYFMAKDQREQVTKWLDESTAEWRIVLGHHPFRSNGPHGNAGNYEGWPLIPILSGDGVEKFTKEVICGRADLYLAGHDHSRQWLGDTCEGTEFAVSGAGSETTELDHKVNTHFQSATLGFLYVTIQGNVLTAQFVDVNGTVDFTRTLTK